MTVAFVDIETTGLHPELDHVWQIAVIVDGEEHCWTQWFAGREWRASVSQWVLENTRIATDYNPATATPPRRSIDRFVELTRGRHLVGACPWFDSERLHKIWRLYEPRDWELPWHYHLIDVEALAVGYLAAKGEKVEVPWKSHALTERVGVTTPVEDEHTALGDARWAKRVYEAVIS